MLRTSLLGRESSCSSIASYRYERGVKQNNNYSTPIFEGGMNVVTEGYVRSIPLSRISNAHKSSQRTATSTLGEVSVTAQDNNSISLQGKKNSLIETDHASMPLGIIASKLVSLSDWQIRPTATHHSLKKAVFTLAEVLITLGIISVVAALTLPTVISNYQEKATIAKVKKFYSIISQAHLQAIEEKGTPDNWNLGGFLDVQGAENLINAWAPYLKITKFCGRNKGCYPDAVYKDLSGGLHYNINNSKPFATAMLADGFLIDTQSLDPFIMDGYGKIYGAVHVDVNGKLGPNTYGKDHFRFYVTDKAIVPSGMEASWNYNFYTACLNNKTDMQGTACTAWVLFNENMDYLHCKDLNWNGKKSCKEK